MSKNRRGSRSHQRERERAHSGQYMLERHVLRSLLTLLGPLCLTGFYAFVCICYLQQAPVNGVVQRKFTDARWVFYVWFILAILAQDWGRIALTNIEAATLMKPKYAPMTATQLMWHVDANWANPLWWLRGLRALASTLKEYITGSSRDTGRHEFRPDLCWYMYAITSALLLAALSLSGLSFQLQDVYEHGYTQAPIFGPNISTLNLRVQDEVPQMINTAWQSGRQTTPQGGAIFYAPKSTKNVSLTYFDDEASRGASSIEFFTGPSVHQSVHGEAWGIWSNMSCRHVAPKDLEVIRWHDGNGSYIRGCNIPGPPEAFEHTQQCNLTWLDIEDVKTRRAWPAWMSDGLRFGGGNDTSFQRKFVVVADGSVGMLWPGFAPQRMTSERATTFPPGVYDNAYGHDEWTFDSLVQLRPRKKPTTALFEVFLSTTYAGGGYGDHIGVHCDVATLTGFAKLDPGHRTFSNFRFARAHNIVDNSTGTLNPMTLGPFQISPIQVIAAGVLATNQDMGKIARPLARPAQSNGGVDLDFAPSIISIFNAINKAVSLGLIPEMTAGNAQYGIYKLLGETVIALMGDSSTVPWYGDLYSMRPTKYLVKSVVSWKIVLATLVVWSSIVSSGAVWLLLFAGPRWASSLNGFEMFKFGAQYSDEVNRFRTPEAHDCADILDGIPGMVGFLPGNGLREDENLGFIGLSENEVRSGTVKDKKKGRVRCTMNRMEAAKTRRYL